MKKKKFFILKIILIVIISVIIGGVLYSFNAKRLGSRIPMPFGFGVATVESDSMWPVFKQGDAVIVVPQDDYEVGDIVAYQDGSSITSHRIIEENLNGTFITKGDNNPSQDTEPLREEYIIGSINEEKGVVPYLGYVVYAIRNPIVIVMMIAIIVLLLILSTKKEKEQDVKEINEIKKEIATLKGNASQLTIEELQAQIDALKKESGKEENKRN